MSSLAVEQYLKIPGCQPLSSGEINSAVQGASCVVNTYFSQDDSHAALAPIQAPASLLSEELATSEKTRSKKNALSFHLVFGAHLGGQKGCLWMSSDQKTWLSQSRGHEWGLCVLWVLPELPERPNGLQKHAFVQPHLFPFLALEWLCCPRTRFTVSACTWKSEPAPQLL